MTGLRLMVETDDSMFVDTLSEENGDGTKSLYIEGIYMQGNKQNRNGRVYPSTVLEREMFRYERDMIKSRRALGELGHPQGPKINEDRASHMITEMRRDGNNFIGKAKVLSTPMGKIVESFIRDGVQIGVSTRGLGSVKRNSKGINEVQEDFWLATVDVVTDPSGPDCFVNGIYENAEFFMNATDGSWRSQQMIEDIVEEIKSPEKFDEAKALRLFEKYFNALAQQ